MKDLEYLPDQSSEFSYLSTGTVTVAKICERKVVMTRRDDQLIMILSRGVNESVILTSKWPRGSMCVSGSNKMDEFLSFSRES